MPAGQPSVRATSRSTSAGASPRPSRPLRNSAASAPVKRSSSARSSASWPCARSVPSGSSGSVRVAITSWTPGGRCAANQATAVTSEMRWKSSSTSATSPTSASALTSRGSTTSRTGAVTARAGERLVVQRRADAAERLDDVRPEDDVVVVALVQRDPGDGPPRGLLLAPRGEQRRLAEPGRAGDQGQRPALAQARGQPLARDRLRGHERRVQLGDEEDRLLGTHCGLIHAVQSLTGGAPRAGRHLVASGPDGAVRDPAAPGALAALRPAARGRRRAQVVGGSEGPVHRSAPRSGSPSRSRTTRSRTATSRAAPARAR